MFLSNPLPLFLIRILIFKGMSYDPLRSYAETEKIPVFNVGIQDCMALNRMKIQDMNWNGIRSIAPELV